MASRHQATNDYFSRTQIPSRALVALTALCTSANAESYTFIDLGALAGATYSYATGINSAGQVVGGGNSSSQNHALIWNGSTVTDLGAPAGGRSAGMGINDVGQVAGYSDMGIGTVHAVRWDGTTPTDLGALYLGWEYQGRSINRSGQVVGTSGTPNNAVRATRWDGVTPTDLGTLGGGSGALAINDSGVIVGFSFTLGGSALHAVMWNGTELTDLNQNDSGSSAYDINASGRIVGSAWRAGVDQQAAVWDGNVRTFLSPSGGLSSAANAISNVGQIVGFTCFADCAKGQHATLWNGKIAIDLNSFLPSGWGSAAATDINDGGWIVGNAVNSSGETHAFLLTSTIPESKTDLLMLAGLGGLALVRRKKRSAPGHQIDNLALEEAPDSSLSHR